MDCRPVAVTVSFVVVLNLDPLSTFPVEAVAVRTAVLVAVAVVVADR